MARSSYSRRNWRLIASIRYAALIMMGAAGWFISETVRVFIHTSHFGEMNGMWGYGFILIDLILIIGSLNLQVLAWKIEDSRGK